MNISCWSAPSRDTRSKVSSAEKEAESCWVRGRGPGVLGWPRAIPRRGWPSDISLTAKETEGEEGRKKQGDRQTNSGVSSLPKP